MNVSKAKLPSAHTPPTRAQAPRPKSSLIAGSRRQLTTVDRIDVILEAEPAQISELQKRVNQLVNVISIRLERAPKVQTGVHLLINVTSGMMIPTRVEIQRLATENNVLLQHCGPST